MYIYPSDSPELVKYKNAGVVIIPAPYEKTTTYGKGTKNGPAAIANASFQVELYDEELDAEPYHVGIHAFKPSESLEELSNLVAGVLKDKKFPIVLGGEHALSIAPVKAAKKNYPDLSVVQFDAHADLRDSYENTPLSHACVMRRIHELDVPFAQIGIRNLSIEEAEFLKKNNFKPFYAHEIRTSSNWMDEAIKKLSDHVYLTFDVDAFDPSVIPATGTPEPGGLDWYQVITFFKKLLSSKKVVGADFVELAPREGDPRSEFTIAKLIYKLIGYIQ